MLESQSWIEDLMRVTNLEYYHAHLSGVPQKRKPVDSVPDLKDNDFWDKGETLK